jgi:hypothetical protein
MVAAPIPGIRFRMDMSVLGIGVSFRLFFLQVIFLRECLNTLLVATVIAITGDYHQLRRH